MKMYYRVVSTLWLVLILGICQTLQARAAAESVVHLTVLHLNDVYEITPVSGGMLGGVARVATLKKQLQAQNPNTIMTFSGDSYTPSAASTAIVEGTSLDGEHAVDALNTMGVNYMAFGDHEFHVSTEKEFYQRLSATTFPILCANIFDANGKPFPGVAEHVTFDVSNTAGKKVRVGIFGVTEDLGGTPVQIKFIDPFKAAATQVKALADQVDILIAMTHQRIEDDLELARRFPQIDVVLGGDEHEQTAKKAGEGLATVYKTDSNARSVYILDVLYDTEKKSHEIQARFEKITDALADDAATKQVVDRWMKVIFDAFRAQGVDPEEVVATASVDLDGFSSSVRNRPTEFTRIIADSMLKAAPDAEMAVDYSAIIRIDDILPAGSAVTQYDILRTFPLGNPMIVTAKMKGDVLKNLLDFGLASVGKGSYLVRAKAEKEGDHWMIDGQPLDTSRTYLVATTEDFAVAPPGGATVEEIVSKHSLLREAVAAQLKSLQ